jgi:hypothetical protein
LENNMKHEKAETPEEEAKELHTRLVGYFEDYESQSRDARQLNERDRDYVDHKQLTDEERRILKQRKQPPTINNRIRKKINFLRGFERQIRTDPSARPRNPTAEKDADSVTDALRYVADNINFDVTRSDFWDNLIVEGTAGCEVIINRRKEIITQHIHWDRLFWDYHSRRHDFSDAKYTGIVIWDDKDSLLASFPDAEDVISGCFNGDTDDTYSDKPVKWVDSKRKRVRAIQMYFIHKGKWHLAFFTKAGFLTDVVESPWLDENGEPENGMVMQSAYVDREGNRFGEPRFMIEQQDAINKRESKMLHLVSQRQTFGNKRAFPDGVQTQKRELAKPDGHIEMSGGAEFGRDFGVLPTGDMANGQFTLLQEAKSEIDQTSVTGFLPNQDTRNQSGRAIIAQQTGTQVEINPLADGKRQWEMRVYRAWWNRIRQFWTEEKWIRVTDDEDNLRFVGLNKPVTVAEVLQEENTPIPPELMNDPRLQMVSRVDNKVAEIDVDIIIEDAPDITTIKQEEFENLISLANVGITFPQEVYIRASNLRNKQALLDLLKGASEAEQQAMAQKQQAAEQLQAESLSALAEKDASYALLNQAKAVTEQVKAHKTMKEIAETVADTQQTMVETDQMRAGLK